jgi:hypothetical protein
MIAAYPNTAEKRQVEVILSGLPIDPSTEVYKGISDI